VKAGTFVKTL